MVELSCTWDQELSRGPQWVIPEKIYTSPTDGTLEILVGGGVEGSGSPGGRGGLDLELFFEVIKNVTSVFQIFDFTEETSSESKKVVVFQSMHFLP